MQIGQNHSRGMHDVASEEQCAINTLVGMREVVGSDDEVDHLEDDDMGDAGGLGAYPGNTSGGNTANSPDPGHAGGHGVGSDEAGVNDLAHKTRAQLEYDVIYKDCVIKLLREEIDRLKMIPGTTTYIDLFEQRIASLCHQLALEAQERDRLLQEQDFLLFERDTLTTRLLTTDNVVKQQQERIGWLEDQAQRVYGQLSRENGEGEWSYAMKMMTPIVRPRLG